MSLILRARLPLAILALAVFSGIMGCSRAQSQPKMPLGQSSATPPSNPARDALSDAARAALDKGNAEYRAGRYAEALAAYRDAVKEAPGNSAPFFGIYMAAKKLNNAALADSASGAIAALAGANPMLSDSSMREIHSRGKREEGSAKRGE